jgi:hypothetical protein
MELLANITGQELRSYLVAAVGSLGLLWYYLCLLDLGLRPTAAGSQPSGFRQFQALSITTISVSLATYVGYVVGIPLASNGELAQSISQAVAPMATSPAAAASAVEAAVTEGSRKVTLLQWLSAAMYVVSLMLAVAFYAHKKDETEPAITGLAKSLLGFVAGIFSVGLNTGA